MKKIVIAALAVALISSSAMAQTFGFWGAQGGAGAGGSFGGTRDQAGSTGFSQTHTFGSSTANSSTEGYGQSESTFKGTFQGAGAGPLSATGWTQQGSVLTGSGSMANTATTSNGNGNSGATAGNTAFGSGFSGGLTGAGSIGGVAVGN